MKQKLIFLCVNIFYIFHEMEFANDGNDNYYYYYSTEKL